MKSLLSRTLYVSFAISMIVASAAPALAGGYLWLSAEFQSSPGTIYRYNLSTGVIDLSVVPGIAGDVVNNLATDGTTLYLGTDDNQDFWTADPVTGATLTMGSYVPATNPSSMEDGAYRAANGHLYRSNYTSATERMYETDTAGNVLASFVVNNVDHVCGLEFVGDQLYGTSLDGKSFGSLADLGGGIWQYTQIPLATIPAVEFYGGLAYDQEDGILYLATTDGSAGFLWKVDPGAGTAVLVKNLTTQSGYPAGFILPDAMGWVRDVSTQAAGSSWGTLKGLYR